MKSFPDSDERKYKAAKKRVKKVKDFYNHLTTWLIFAAFFIFLDITSGPGKWAFWPIMGWGIGVAFHALGVFGVPGVGKDWEQRMLEKEMARMEEAENGHRSSKRLPQQIDDPEDGLELKEVRKAWRDQDLV